MDENVFVRVAKYLRRYGNTDIESIVFVETNVETCEQLSIVEQLSSIFPFVYAGNAFEDLSKNIKYVRPPLKTLKCTFWML